MASGETHFELRTGDPPGGADFPQTRWSLLLEDRNDPKDGEGQKEVWEALATAYWKPVYGYVRTRWAKTSDDALDATQEFFLWMLESGFLSRADPARGRFRGFVKTALENFLTDLERKRRALKRGGERTFLSIHADAGESPVPELPDTGGQTPEEVLDELWRGELVERAVRALESELRASGKSVYFEVFRDYFLKDEELDYEAVAERYGITRVDVSNYLAYVKRRYRAQLERSVLETCGGRQDFDVELAWLLEGRGE